MEGDRIARRHRGVQEPRDFGTGKVERTGGNGRRHGQALQPQPCGNGGGAVAGIPEP